MDSVVGLIAQGGIEGGMKRGSSGGVEFEVILEREGGGGIGGWDGCGVGGPFALHGGGEPALAVGDVAIPEDCGGNGACGDREGEVAAGVEGGGRCMLRVDGRPGLRVSGALSSDVI
jgi:hypothetical protein